MPTRREFLKLAGAGLALSSGACQRRESEIMVNDVHSQLNPTRVRAIQVPDSLASLRAAIQSARRDGLAVSIAGGRHAMGGQQFGTDALLLDMSKMKRVLKLDNERGLVEVEAGIQWPELVRSLRDLQRGVKIPWSIIQKQTGADRLSIGGALGANIHGRGLRFRPFIQDVESFSIVTADGNVRRCSRSENSELFQLAIGGYGLFGAIATVSLRLTPRTKLERNVEIIDIEKLMPALDQRIAAGYLYGDCQFSTDMASDGFLKTGVFSCYRPLPANASMPPEQKELAEKDWRELYYLAHADTRRTYKAYSSYYLSTHQQRYWSDTHQLSVYVDDYHKDVDRRIGGVPGTEMISELYVPRAALPEFLKNVRSDLRQHATQLIYGTIRLIEKDNESFLAWAREPWACVVMNLHVTHSEDGRRQAEVAFRRLIDRAIEHGGSYFLTYHRWASRAQVEACYPQMLEFLRYKRRHDPQEVFQSDWYRHYRRMFADKIFFRHSP